MSQRHFIENCYGYIIYESMRMVSVVFANLVGYRLMGRSIFDVQLKALGFG